MSQKLAQESIIVSSKELPFRHLEEELVALDLEGDRYLGFNAVGGRIWELIQRPIAFSDLVEAILHEYDVEREVLIEELSDFLQRLIELDLARVQGETA